MQVVSNIRGAASAAEIYLDYNATTPTDSRVVEAMLPFFTSEFGNPASGQHAFGLRALAAVEEARADVSGLVGGAQGDLVFTASSTEATNLLIKGLSSTASRARRRVVISTVEHRAVLETTNWLASNGVPVSHIPVDRFGIVDFNILETTLRLGDTHLVSILAANNETGTLNPIGRIASMAHQYDAIFHTDATQMTGKLPLDLSSLCVDAASIAAHKIYGPKGVAALYVGPSVRRRIMPLIHGGGHEGGLRSGTLNVPGIVGFGCAATLAAAHVSDDSSRLRLLRDRLHAELDSIVGNVLLNGHPTERLPNTLNLRFVGAEADAIIANAPTLAVSTGSACTSSIPSPSHVLTAMGLDEGAASESIRFSLGRPTTSEEVDLGIQIVNWAVSRVRKLAGAG